MEEFIVDVQGFKKPQNEFVFKELAIIPLSEDSQPTVYFFEPPYNYNLLPVKYRSENSWLKRNFHGLHWEDGDIPYGDLEDIFSTYASKARKIFVKGLEKKRWIQEITSNLVYNVEDIGCPALSKISNLDKFKPCSHHDECICRKPNCAVKNVLILKKWLLNYYNSPILTTYKEKHDSNSDNYVELSQGLKNFFESF
jgi:hypothetical protein